MSAAELIEQIKALPPAEVEVIRSFLLNGREGAEEGDTKYLEPEEARALGDKVMGTNEELFRRLAQ